MLVCNLIDKLLMSFEVNGKDILYVSRQRRFRLCIAENIAEYG